MLIISIMKSFSFDLTDARMNSKLSMTGRIETALWSLPYFLIRQRFDSAGNDHKTSAMNSGLNLTGARALSATWG